MRTPKALYPNERIIYHPELSTCPQCGGPLVMYNYLAWDKTVQTLDGILSVASRPGHCKDKACLGHTMRLLSAQGQQVALPGSTYGYDALVRIGWLRQERRATFAEIKEELSGRVQISHSHIHHLYYNSYLPLLACQERQHWERLTQATREHGGLIIALDGLAPEGGEPQLWFIRELLTGLTLRSGWLSRQDQQTFEAFLAPLSKLCFPVLAVLSDKQRGLVPAVASVFADSVHQFCQAHYLRNLAEPLAKDDSTFNVELRIAVREQVGELIRAEQSAPQIGELCVTGLVPDELSADESKAGPRHDAMPELSAASQVVSQLLRHTRYLLTLKGRPPFRLAGIETYERLKRVIGLSKELLGHRYQASLAHLSEGLTAALTPVATYYRELAQGASWLGEIARILEPPADTSTTGQQVAQRLQTYLDGLYELPELPPRLKGFRDHLDKVSGSYWPGLFHCYDILGLPRTNNELESHFRDTQRRLLRTSGQKGQTRRTLQRTGAWELLPRPATEAECLASLSRVSQAQLAKEQQRLLTHSQRFRLHSRSIRRAEAQFARLRQQWLALASTTSG